MTKNNPIHWIGYGFIAIAMLAILNILVQLIVSMIGSLEKDKIGDAATWAGAVFAGLAFGGTIWIANSDSRRRNRESTLLAMIAAPRMVMRIAQLKPTIQAALLVLNDNRHGYGATFKFMHSELDISELWSAEEILPFIDLPQKCAMKLVLAREMLILSNRIFADDNAANRRTADTAISNFGKILYDFDIVLPILLNLDK